MRHGRTAGTERRRPAAAAETSVPRSSASGAAAAAGAASSSVTASSSPTPTTSGATKPPSPSPTVARRPAPSPASTSTATWPCSGSTRPDVTPVVVGRRRRCRGRRCRVRRRRSARRRACGVTLGFVSATERAFRGPRGRRITGSVEHTAPLVPRFVGRPDRGRARASCWASTPTGSATASTSRCPPTPSCGAASTRSPPGSRRRRLAWVVGLAPAHVARKLRRSVGLPERDGLLVRVVEDGGPGGAGRGQDRRPDRRGRRQAVDHHRRAVRRARRRGGRAHARRRAGHRRAGSAGHVRRARVERRRARARPDGWPSRATPSTPTRGVVIAVAERVLPSVASLRVMRAVPGGRVPRGSGSAVVLSGDGFLRHVGPRGRRAPGRHRHLRRRARARLRAGRRRPALGPCRRRCGRERPARPGACVAPPSWATPTRCGSASWSSRSATPLGFAGSVSAGVVERARPLAHRVGRPPRPAGRERDPDRRRAPPRQLRRCAGQQPGRGRRHQHRGRRSRASARVSAWPCRSTTRPSRSSRPSCATAGCGGRSSASPAGTRPLPPRAAARLGLEAGLEVTSVVAGSPAARAGLRPEEVIVAVDGTPGRRDRRPPAADDRRPASTRRVRFTVLRGGDVVDVDMVPVELQRL